MKNVRQITVSANQTDNIEGQSDSWTMLLFCFALFFLVQFCLSMLPGIPADNSACYLRITDSGTLSLAPTPYVMENSIANADFSPFFFETIPVNYCNKDLLMAIPGIGQGIADNIIKTRDDITFFNSPQDLLLVDGIGESRMKKIAPYLNFSSTFK